MLAFLLTSTWLFWAFLAVFVVVEVGLLAADNDDSPMPVSILGVFVVAALLTALFTDALKGVDWLWLIPAAAAYAAVGVAWSLKKWFDFVSDALATAMGRYQNWKSERPSAARNKQRIITWMALWPFSMAWWVLTWPRRLFSWLYDRLGTVFDRVTASVWDRGS